MNYLFYSTNSLIDFVNKLPKSMLGKTYWGKTYSSIELFHHFFYCAESRPMATYFRYIAITAMMLGSSSCSSSAAYEERYFTTTLFQGSHLQTIQVKTPSLHCTVRYVIFLVRFITSFCEH